MSDEIPSKPGQGYEPDLPPIPEGDVNQQTKYVLELYAAEIREHVAGVVAIYGLSPTATDRYKQHCYAACKELEAAAKILRDNNLLSQVKIFKMGPEGSTAETEGEKSMMRTLGRFFGRAVAPGLLVFALGELAFYYTAAIRAAVGF